MPISSYSGETFVAFLDICGFKEMMKREEQALMALNRFYNTIYRIGRSFARSNRRRGLLKVAAVVVSDCAVLFSRCSGSHQDKIAGLRSILSFIRQVNRSLISSDPELMTTCSIDLGSFRYEDGIEFNNIDKEFFVGKPYLGAFLGNQRGKPRIQPGQCRLLKKTSYTLE